MTPIDDPTVNLSPGGEAGAPHPATVRELIVAAQKGDRRAAEELFRIHEPFVLGWVSRRLGLKLRSLDDTRDVLHDAYAIVLLRVGDFNPDDAANFGRWLRAILHRVLLRKSDAPDVKRREALPQDVTAAAADITMNTRLSLPEIEAMKERLLEGFEDVDRVIWRERQRGVPSTELADRLGMTDRNIRLRFAKTDAAIRVRLRKALGEDHDDVD